MTDHASGCGPSAPTTSGRTISSRSAPMMEANSACSTSSTNLPTNVWPFRYRAGSDRSMSSMCSPTCSHCAAFPGISVPIMARSSLPRRCRSGSVPSEQRPPTSHQAVHGRTGSSRVLMPAARRAARWRDLLHAAGSADHHRKLAASLQHRAAACLDRLPGSGTGGVRASTRRMAGCAIPTSSAGHAPAGAEPDPKLTFDPDHLVGAGQGAIGLDYYLLHVHRDRLEVPELRRAIVDLSFRWKADPTLIEKTELGRAIAQDLASTGA